MPVHDWTCVEAGVFHAFHHRWISAISDVLNEGILPGDDDALPEQYAAGLGPDVLAPQGPQGNQDDEVARASNRGGGSNLLLAKSSVSPTAESDIEFYRRKQNHIAVRHVSGDRVVAIIELISPGNKSSRHAFRALVEKAAQLLDQGIHLLLIDLFPPWARDRRGLHAAVWEEITGEEATTSPDKPLTLAAYESALTLRAYVRHVNVGDVLPPMQLFLEPDACVMAPLEPTYQTAFNAMPRRWREVLQPSRR